MLFAPATPDPLTASQITPSSTSVGLRVGGCLLLPRTRQVLVAGKDAPLGGRAFDLLMALVARRDRVVSKEELVDLIWPDVAVEPNNLHVQIWALRRVLGHDAIKTVARRGYQLAAVVEPVAGSVAQAARPQATLPATDREVAIPLPTLGAQLALRMASERWLSLVGLEAPLRRLACDAACRAYARTCGATIWRWQAPVRGSVAQSHCRLLERLQRIGGVLVLPELTGEEDLHIAKFLETAPPQGLPRIISTSAAGTPVWGETLFELPRICVETLAQPAHERPARWCARSSEAGR